MCVAVRNGARKNGSGLKRRQGEPCHSQSRGQHNPQTQHPIRHHAEPIEPTINQQDEADAPLIYAAICAKCSDDGHAAASRIMMKMARDGRSWMPKVMEKVNDRTSTPMVATLASGAIVLGLAMFLPLKTLASGTSGAKLLVFTAIDASLCRLESKRQPDNMPDIWNIVPILGTEFCALTIVGQIVL